MSNKKRDIVKVQLSLFSSDGVRDLLIYNQDESILWQTSDPEWIVKIEYLLDPDYPKGYFFFRQLKNGEIELLEEAEEQDW